MRLNSALVLLALALVLLAGCGSDTSGPHPQSVEPTLENDTPYSATDDFGREVSIPLPPHRIISLAPNTTEILYALGLEEEVAGVSDYCDYPPQVAEKPRMGRYDRPSIEKIIAVQPDLVLLGYGNPKELVAMLEDLGIPVFGVNPTSIEEILADIERIGEICGAAPQAARLTQTLRQRLAQVKADLPQTAEGQKPRVFIAIDEASLWTAGANTLQDEIVTLAGGVNVAACKDSYYPISQEALLQGDPDIVLVAADPERARALKEEGYSAEQLTVLRTVTDAEVIVIDGDTFSRPGPRVIESVEELSRRLHTAESQAD